jgi:hypothetical protein
MAALKRGADILVPAKVDEEVAGWVFTRTRGRYQFHPAEVVPVEALDSAREVASLIRAGKVNYWPVACDVAELQDISAKLARLVDLLPETQP